MRGGVAVCVRGALRKGGVAGLKHAVEFAAGPEDGEQGDECGEGGPVGPEGDAVFEGAGFGEGVDFADEVGDLGGLDDAAAGDAGHFREDFGACGLAGFFDFGALGEEGGFERFVFGAGGGGAEFPGAGEVDLEAAGVGAQADWFFWSSRRVVLPLGEVMSTWTKPSWRGAPLGSKALALRVTVVPGSGRSGVKKRRTLWPAAMFRW